MSPALSATSCDLASENGDGTQPDSPFGWLKWVIHHARAIYGLKPGEHHVALVIASYANRSGHAFPSPRTISLMTGLAVSTVNNTITQLKRAGLIRKGQCVTPYGKHRVGYQFVWSAPLAAGSAKLSPARVSTDRRDGRGNWVPPDRPSPPSPEKTLAGAPKKLPPKGRKNSRQRERIEETIEESKKGPYPSSSPTLSFEGPKISSSAIPFAWFVFERDHTTPGEWRSRRIWAQPEKAWKAEKAAGGMAR